MICLERYKRQERGRERLREERKKEILSEGMQVLRKPKHMLKLCKAWNFQFILHTDLLGKECVTTHEKTNLLTEHLQT